MKLTFLGTGTSFGVPMIGCQCRVCRSPDPRDKRTRVGAVVETDRGTRLLLDTPPELRIQLIANGIDRVDEAKLAKAIATVRERARTFVEAADAMDFYFRAEPVVDEKARAKFMVPANAPILAGLAPVSLKTPVLAGAMALLCVVCIATTIVIMPPYAE